MLAGCLIKPSTQRWGKPTTRGRTMTEVRSPQRKLRPDTVGLDQHEPTSRRGIAKRASAGKDHRFQDLYRCLDANLLLACWGDLNQDAASGVDQVTAQA